MGIDDMKKELESKMLINPIVTEAITMANKGVSENVAFCWSTLRLLDETEFLKTQLAETKKVLKAWQDSVEEYKFILANTKQDSILLKSRLMKAEAALAANGIPKPY